MKIAQKLMEMIEESSHDVNNIADYLANALEHDDDSSAVKHMKKEFGLSDAQVTSLLSWWDKLGPKGQLKLSMDANKISAEIEKQLMGKK